VSRYEKGKTNLDLTEARDSEWQWHQLDHMQVCTLLQADNHASTPPLSFFTGRMPLLLPNQQRQSTEGMKHCSISVVNLFSSQLFSAVYQHSSISVVNFLTSYFQLLVNFVPEPKKRAWRHGRAWKMKTCAWKNQDPCFNFYKQV